MATIVDRPHPFPPVTAHHVRSPGRTPPHHTRAARARRAVRHAGTHRRYVVRDLAVALLTVAVAAAVVWVLLQNADPAVRAGVLGVVQDVRGAVEARVGGLPLPWAG